jgi:hypothetical protein
MPTSRHQYNDSTFLDHGIHHYSPTERRPNVGKLATRILEIPKCVLALFNWTFDKWGRAVLSDKKSHHLHIQSSDTNTPSLIPFLPLSIMYQALDQNNILQKPFQNRISCPLHLLDFFLKFTVQSPPLHKTTST